MSDKHIHENHPPIALMIGAGPAGLTAAWELLKQDLGYQVIILESTHRIGGISCTIEHHGNRMDIGGHRFFSKSDTVMDWWTQRMKIQGAPARDDIALNRKRSWEPNGPDPEKSDRVMLLRQRISRIFYLRKFFDYPISMKPITFINMGLKRTFKAGMGYLASRLHQRPQENNLEDFMVNRFGTPLYQMFFEKYTEKVWGKHPRDISAAWGAQRIKGLSLSKALLSALGKIFSRPRSQDFRQKDTETSLIEQFLYPKLGPGQLWETVAEEIRDMGGKILMEHEVTQIHMEGQTIRSVTARTPEGDTTFSADLFFSTMPIKDLVEAMPTEACSSEIRSLASGLPYRDFQTVGILAEKLQISNTTKIPSVRNIVPDCWIYIQEADVKLCRLQIFNNWSPYMVQNPNHVWVGLEYMCDDTDDIWKMDDSSFIQLATEELSRIGIVDPQYILDSVRVRIPKAYPAYFGTYEQFDQVRNFLDSIPNLYCMGRNGQHRYNNQDHSMLTAMEAVRCVREGIQGRDHLWSVNSEEEYHESK